MNETTVKGSHHKKIIGIIFLLLVAFSLPFQYVIHAKAYDDQGKYTLDEWHSIEQVSIDFWNWAHNDLRTPILSKLDDIDTILSASGITGTSDKLESLEAAVSDIDVSRDLENFYQDKESEGSTDIDQMPINFTSNKIKLANRMWAWVGKAISAGGDLSEVNFSDYSVSLGIDIDNIEKEYSALIDAMKIVAYSIVLLFFSVSLIESTIKYEIATVKGGVMLFGRLLISKVIIDLSATFCVRIVGVVKWASRLAVDSINVSAQTQAISTNIAQTSSSNLWIIGKIVDLFSSTFITAEYLAMAVVVLIVSMCILGKLSLRSVQLALMTSVSPIFFACTSTDVTKPYFRNFITSFLQCAIQILFMVIVYAMGSKMLGNDSIGGSLLNQFGSTYINSVRAMLIYIVMGILIVKPPRFLTNMLN